MASPFPEAEVITHDAGGCELFGVVLKFHFEFYREICGDQVSSQCSSFVGKNN